MLWDGLLFISAPSQQGWPAPLARSMAHRLCCQVMCSIYSGDLSEAFRQQSARAGLAGPRQRVTLGASPEAEHSSCASLRNWMEAAWRRIHADAAPANRACADCLEDLDVRLLVLECEPGQPSRLRPPQPPSGPAALGPGRAEPAGVVRGAAKGQLRAGKR